MKSKANKKKRPMPVGSGDLLGIAINNIQIKCKQIHREPMNC